MKKITMISVVAAVVLFVGCGEKTKEAGESVGVATEKAVEATKEAATVVATETKEAAKEVVTKAVDSAKEGVAEATAKVADAAQNVAGAAAYAKCVACHGVDGKTKALGKSEVIAGQSKADLVMKITEYREGTRNTAQMGTLMKGQVGSMSDADIDTVANYISTLK